MRTDDLLDTGTHPEIYADDTGDVLFIGSNVRYVLFTWKRIDGVFRRCICAQVIKPISSIPAHRQADLRARYPGTAMNICDAEMH